MSLNSCMEGLTSSFFVDFALFFPFVSSSPLAANVISKVFVISFTFGDSVGILFAVGLAFSTALLLGFLFVEPLIVH